MAAEASVCTCCKRRSVATDSSALSQKGHFYSLLSERESYYRRNISVRTYASFIVVNIFQSLQQMQEDAMLTM